MLGAKLFETKKMLIEFISNIIAIYLLSLTFCEGVTLKDKYVLCVMEF